MRISYLNSNLCLFCSESEYCDKDCSAPHRLLLSVVDATRGLKYGQNSKGVGGTWSVWGDTGCNLVVLGQYNLVLIGIEWYRVNKGL